MAATIQSRSRSPEIVTRQKKNSKGNHCLCIRPLPLPKGPKKQHLEPQPPARFTPVWLSCSRDRQSHPALSSHVLLAGCPAARVSPSHTCRTAPASRKGPALVVGRGYVRLCSNASTTIRHIFHHHQSGASLASAISAPLQFWSHSLLPKPHAASLTDSRADTYYRYIAPCASKYFDLVNRAQARSRGRQNDAEGGIPDTEFQ